MHSPYSLGPPPNRRLVGCNRITPYSLPSLLLILAVIATLSLKRVIGNPHQFPILFSIFCPHPLPTFPNFFLFQISTSSFDNGIKAPKKQDGLEGGGNSKMKGNGSISGKDMIFRADQIDLKSLDMQLEKHLSRVWSRNIEKQRPAEEWEIDLAKLDLRNVIAHGTYGTVYRATYDNEDVAALKIML
ncbi:uncharacterized protein LOC105789157 isoform X2 [Gossypium raimondii]|uniref:uncharacterized protein LOC105789157 isoform X2 n=1 Tax=Gossypium raimondii TaxID=29730 RepID=UPI00227CF529|nr:uncharacterized protein LOC105789157 isoform X2 [Gossypium raimondii]